MRPRWSVRLETAATLVLVACGAGPDVLLRPDPAIVESSSVVPGPYNVLSAVVTASVRDADSVAVLFGRQGLPLDSVTPAVPARMGTLSLPVLGLTPEAAYQLRVVAWGKGGAGLGPTLSLVTGSLPADLPVYSAEGTDPSPGYVVFAAGGYGLTIDNSGRVVWYRHLDQGPTLNFQVQPTGVYTTMPITADSNDPSPWVELDPLGNVVRRMGCARGLAARFHELIEMSDRSWWIMCDETRTLDLSAMGGVAGARVTGTVVQHLRADGTLVFEWSAWNHFALTDLDSGSRRGSSVNWTHGNAMDFDLDGNLLVSFRSLSEITKIDVTSGEVMWRMGGLANQFAFPSGDPPFAGQHGLRVTPSGRLQLLDNLGRPGGSRAEMFQVSASTRTAGMGGSYSGEPPVTALLGGSTQSLPRGHMLVAYGNGNRVQEYDEAGKVVWEIQGNSGYVFRANRILSLYRPGVGTAR